MAMITLRNGRLQKSDQENSENERWDRLKELGHAHERVVELAAEVAGEAADQGAENRRDDGLLEHRIT